MDFFESLGKQLSEVTMYDVKSTFEKAKAMVLNYTEMEAKVHEATNGDAWGASSTLMQEIAASTFNFQLFNEIMPVIYKRFTEKEARDWRQIYKALQLLEYLIKHGSERVVDDARSHLSMIKMLRNFHYIDEKGKDQGINVRNRSKELAELLSDLDRVRQERKKAKINKNKYGGVGNDGTSSGGGGGMSFTTSSGSRYGGFGSDSMGGAGSSSYPDASYPSSATRSATRDSFEEYDAGDDDDRVPAPRGGASSFSSTAAARRASTAPAPIKKDTPVIPQQKTAAKELNLFDFDDDDNAGMPVQAAAAPASKPSIDDDFDDFQAAPSAAPQVAATQPSSGSSNFFDMMSPTATASSSSSSASAFQQSQQPRLRTSQHMPAGPNYNIGMFSPSAQQQQQQGRPNLSGMSHNSTPSMTTTGLLQPSSSSSFGSSATRAQSTSPAPPQQQAKKAGAFDFDDLFAASGAKTTGAGTASGRQGAGANSMASLAAQKGNAQIWGAPASTSTGGGAQNGKSSNGGGGGFDDLLF